MNSQVSRWDIQELWINCLFVIWEQILISLRFEDVKSLNMYWIVPQLKMCQDL